MIIVVIMIVLYAMYLGINGMVNDENKTIIYSEVGCDIETSKNNVSVLFRIEGNYTVLIEYENITKYEAVDKYFIQYELTSVLEEDVHVFDISRDYDYIFVIIRNDDLNFSEGHRID